MYSSCSDFNFLGIIGKLIKNLSQEGQTHNDNRRIVPASTRKSAEIEEKTPFSQLNF